MHHFVGPDFYFFLAAVLGGLLIRPGGSLLQLRYIFAAAMLLGLGGPSLVVLAGGEHMKSYFLTPHFIPVVHRYAAVASLMFWLGYHLTLRRRRLLHIPSSDVGSWSPPAWLLVSIAALPLIFAILEHGFDNLIQANVHRGKNQLGFRTSPPWVTYTYVLTRAIIFPVAATAGLAYGTTRRPVYMLAPILPTLELVATFSRGMFLPVVAFLLGRDLSTRCYRSISTVALAVLLIASSFTLALTLREYSEATGIAYVGEALAFEKAYSYSDDSPPLLRATQRLVEATDALAVTTKVFEVGPHAEGHLRIGYVLSQLPIPSFWLPATAPKTSLSFDLGIFPANYPYTLIGELWVFFSWAGTFIYMVIGWVIARIDARLAQLRGLPSDYITVILYSLLLFFLIRSFHSGLRSSARPLLYFGIAWSTWRYFVRPMVFRRTAGRVPNDTQTVSLNPRASALNRTSHLN